MFRQILSAPDDVNVHQGCQYVFTQRHGYAVRSAVVVAALFAILSAPLVSRCVLAPFRDILPRHHEAEQISPDVCPGLRAFHLFWHEVTVRFFHVAHQQGRPTNARRSTFEPSDLSSRDLWFRVAIKITICEAHGGVAFAMARTQSLVTPIAGRNATVCT